MVHASDTSCAVSFVSHPTVLLDLSSFGITADPGPLPPRQQKTGTLRELRWSTSDEQRKCTRRADSRDCPLAADGTGSDLWATCPPRSFLIPTRRIHNIFRTFNRYDCHRIRPRSFLHSIPSYSLLFWPTYHDLHTNWVYKNNRVQMTCFADRLARSPNTSSLPHSCLHTHTSRIA